MAVLANQYLTLADWASRLDPDGRIADIVNLLSQNNEILDDMLWTEGNLPTGHKTTVRTGLPSAAWRLLNYGVPRGKSTTAQVIDTTGMLEAYALVDKDLADLSGDSASFRMGEDMAFLEGMNQQMAQTLFYGNTQTNPERFLGLSPRFSTVTVANANNAVNVIDGGGTGSTNTSIWLVCWGQTTIHGIFPKGKKAGLQMQDVTTPAPVLDQNGNPYQAYQTHYKWDCGLTVRDWRFVVRIANIDVTLLSKDFSTGADLVDLLGQAMYKPPIMPRSASSIQTATAVRGGMPLSFGRPAIYCNRTIKSFLDRQAMHQTKLLATLSEIDGRPQLSYRGIPIRNADALLDTEARVV